MTRRKGSQGESGQSESPPEMQISPDCLLPKIESEKTKVQPINDPSVNGSRSKKNLNLLQDSDGEKSSTSQNIQKQMNDALPVPKPEVRRDRTKEAIKRLKIKPEQLAKCPPISLMIKECIKGGFDTALRAMRFVADDPLVASFLEKYDSIPESDQERIPWEAVVLAAKIDANQLLGTILFAVQSESVNRVKFITLSHFPDIVRKAVDFAMLPGGEKDRMAFYQASGMIPSPKGPTFIGKAIFSNSQSSQADEVEEAPSAPTFTMEQNENHLFPSATDIQNKLVPIRQRTLPS